MNALQVKSTTLDGWTPAQVDVVAAMGNVRFNAAYEAGLVDRSKKPRPASSMDERERFIRAKYERKAWFGAPSKASLARAASDLDVPLDSLPAGYVAGIGSLVADAAGGWLREGASHPFLRHVRARWSGI
jgi:hypothetical protein